MASRPSRISYCCFNRWYQTLSSLVALNYINDTHILRSTTKAPPAATWWTSTFAVYLHEPLDQANHIFRVNTSLHSRSTSSPQHGGLYRRQSGLICDIRSWYLVSNAYAFTVLNYSYAWTGHSFLGGFIPCISHREETYASFNYACILLALAIQST